MPHQEKRVSFASGEIAEQFHGHDEYRIHQTGLARCRNFVVRPGGGLTRRPPTELVGEALSAARLVPMNIRARDSYLLEFTHLSMRVWRDGRLLVKNNRPFSVSHPFKRDDLPDLRWQSSADVLYVTHPVRGIHQFTRRASTTWSAAAFSFKVPPFLDENIDKSRKIRATAHDGTVTLTAEGFTFTANMVGTKLRFRDGDQRVVSAWESDKTVAQNELRIYNGRVYQQTAAGSPNCGNGPPVHDEGTRKSGHNGCLWKYIRSEYGVAAITAVAVDGATATAEVDIRLPEEFVDDNDSEYGGHASSWRWSEEAFSAKYGWPENVWLHQQRLYFSQGPRLYGSRPSDYRDFTIGSTPDSGLSELLGASTGRADDIVWGMSTKVMLVGVSGQEYVLSAASVSDGISPSNLRIMPGTLDGSRFAEPVRAGASVLHINSDGSKLFDIVYNFQINDFDSEDRALTSSHLTARGLQQIVFQRDPLNIVWARDGAGQLIGFTFNPKQEVLAWHLHPMLGAVVEDMAVIGHPVNGTDDLYLRVRRIINGRERVFLERLREFFNPHRPQAVAALPYIDCQVSGPVSDLLPPRRMPWPPGAKLAAVGNNGHLEGCEVAADGTLHLPEAVRRQIAAREITRLTVGLPMRSWMRLLPAVVPVQDGTGAKRLKVVKQVKLRGVVGPGVLVGDIAEPGLGEAIYPGSAAIGGPILYRTPEDGHLVDGDWADDAMVDLWTDGPFAFDITECDRVTDIGGD